MILEFAALALGATDGTLVAPMVHCTLVTPAGHDISFTAAENLPSAMALTPIGGSVWPKAAVSAPSATGLRDKKFGARAYSLGTAPSDQIIHFGAPAAGSDWQTSTIYSREGRRVRLPLAYGLCQKSAGTPQPSTASKTSAKGAPFDPANWPDDCALISRTGLRARFDFFTMDAVRGDLRNRSGIWSAAITPFTRRLMSDGEPYTSSFSVRGGAKGTDSIFMQDKPSLAVRLVRFQALGGVGVSQNEPAFGICGINSLVRRPSAG